MRGWTQLKRSLGNGRLASQKVLIGFDFDGTLAPIALRPSQAVLPAATRRLIKTLAGRKNFEVAVISGRSLKDVRSKVGIKGIHYAGNHGLELSGPGHSWTHPAARLARPSVKRVVRAIRTQLRKQRGMCLEDKGLSLSLHYREARGVNAPEITRKIVESAAVGFHDTLRVSSGKKVWEVRPRVDWNKGNALLRIAKQTKRRTMIFIGDDRTDEEGFKTLGRRAVTVKVGRSGASNARFRLRDQRQVPLLLGFLCRVAA